MPQGHGLELIDSTYACIIPLPASLDSLDGRQGLEQTRP